MRRKVSFHRDVESAQVHHAEQKLACADAHLWPGSMAGRSPVLVAPEHDSLPLVFAPARRGIVNARRGVGAIAHADRHVPFQPGLRRSGNA